MKLRLNLPNDAPVVVYVEYHQEYRRAISLAAWQIWTCMLLTGKPEADYSDVRHY